jgi:fumarate hydratase subunit alpha
MKDKLAKEIAKAIEEAVITLPEDVEVALKKAYEIEEGIAKLQLQNIITNIEMARRERKPICQDTGMQTFFVEMGVDFKYRGIIKETIIDAVKIATEKVPLRHNAIDILKGKSTGNVGRGMPIIHFDLIPGEECFIDIMPKGGGSENASALKMLFPGDGLEGAKKFVLDTVARLAPAACPPVVVGVAIGGSADTAMKMAKMMLLRKIGERSEDNEIAAMEEELLGKINELGIGAMGLGGKITALDVHISISSRHPATFPVAVAMQCWANRRRRLKIDGDGRIWSIE